MSDTAGQPYNDGARDERARIVAALRRERDTIRAESRAGFKKGRGGYALACGHKADVLDAFADRLEKGET